MKLLFKALLLAVALTVASPGAASADEGPGALTLEGTDEVSASEVAYVVRLTYKGDGHPARDATLTATAIDADGASQTPLAMTVVDQDGRYEATIAFPSPGEWTVRFTAVLPPATLDQVQTIEAPTTTVTELPVTEAPTTTEPPATEPKDDERASDADDDGGLPWLVPIGALVVVGTAGAWFVARRIRP